MKAPVSKPQNAANKSSLTFVLLRHGEPVTCVVSRAALEAYFWLTPDADDARTLKVFRNGFHRIHAIAERKLSRILQSSWSCRRLSSLKADLRSFRAR
ncbi:DUF1488 family protein [Caballeronia calidae]|uniref:DUF1488 family protein n=1 Tax=Caballeronia calidae TaxID=1777139 RepID=UPI000940A43F|nr:DUF1488 family protein [Caballeronia calidae]